MNYRGILEEILGVYRKHGWQVSRVLLSGRALESIGREDDLLKGIEVKVADVDAVWFERPSKKGKRALELRWVSETPFALFELVDESQPEEMVEELKRTVERKLADHASQARKAVDSKNGAGNK